MKLTDKCGCIFNDRIDLELSPSDLEELINTYEKKALQAEHYATQGLYRLLKDYFQVKHDEWKMAREERKED